MAKVSNEALVKEAKSLIKDRKVKTEIAVRWVFSKHHIYSPFRFGEVCRLISISSSPSEASEPPLFTKPVINHFVKKGPTTLWFRSDKNGMA